MAVSREKVIGEAILRSSVRFLELTGWEREEEGSGWFVHARHGDHSFEDALAIALTEVGVDPRERP